MKKFLQFSGLIALGLALVAFILLMACPSVVYLDNVNNWYSGLAAIFAGGKVQGTLGGATITTDFDGKLAATALIAWILIVVAMLILIAGVVLPLLKIKALEKFAGLLNLVAVCSLVIAGVLVFFTVPVFASANDWGNAVDGWGLGAGWIIAGILAILGGVVAILPAASTFLGKKK